MDIEIGDIVRSVFLILVLPMIASVFASVLQLAYCTPDGVVLYPFEGTALTKITMEAYVPINSRNNVFWDNAILALDVHRGQENYPLIMNISCPNEPPYSDLGNHTVEVESFYWDGSDKVAYFNTTFEIIEYVPCAEYLALNSTYYSLLAEYSTLNASYFALQAQYGVLIENYTTLLDSYNVLLNGYNSLSSSYSSLSEQYGSLDSSFQSFSISYSNLLNAYNQLDSSYDDLHSNYNDLHTNYDVLSVNYNRLEADYSTLIADLNMARNINYALASLAMILVATTVYFALRKSKTR